jgi:CubicO group peptidase (beta-lactamase class C family)
MTISDMPRADPEDAGFATERLARITARYSTGVASGEIPGAVVLVMRDGHVVYEEAIGFSERATGTPMTLDTRFWLASMTKPVTSVAAMMLIEEGRVDLSAPVAKYLPELNDLAVGVVQADGTLARRTPLRQPTIQDLMRHTAGFVYGEFGSSPVHQAYVATELFTKSHDMTELVKRLAALPLAHEPGTTFEYSIATDVLGRLVEVVSGEPIDHHIARRIAAPLGMTSMDFHVPAGLPVAWADGIATVPGRDAIVAAVRRPPRLLSGGGGLYGTARDYARFAQMLLNGGELDGARLLSPRSVALMTANHLPDGIRFAAEVTIMLSVVAPVPALGQGFGLGFAVRTDPGLHPAPGSVGDFYWAGAGGTYFWVDPAERLVAVVLTAQPEYEIKVRYRQLARTLVYQAMTVSRQPAARPGRRISATGHTPAQERSSPDTAGKSFKP